MYADLFLALMVIFLATISFVPEQLGKANSSTSERVSSGYFSGSTFNYDLGFTYLLKTPEVSPLRAGITDFLAKKKLPSDSQVIFIQIVGGYDPNSEKASDGVTTAVRYALALKQGDPELFANSTRSLDTSPKIKSGEALIRMTFGPTLNK